MMVRYFSELPVDYELASRVLCSPVAEWLPGSQDHGRFTFELRVEVAGAEITKDVELTLGTPAHGPSKTSIPIGWNATGLAALFPRLDGRVVVSPYRQHTTLLTLMLSYDPPLGAVGRAADKLLLHKLAWATLDDFRDRLGAAIGVAAEEVAPHGVKRVA
jgi:hypothetical protein